MYPHSGVIDGIQSRREKIPSMEWQCKTPNIYVPTFRHFRYGITSDIIDFTCGISEVKEDVCPDTVNGAR